MSGSRPHVCHALGCEVAVPPKMHMCRSHWAAVPKPLQRRLWAAYRPGQENRIDPTPEYLRAVAACVRAVAEAECHPHDEIDFEVGLYESWAEMLEAAG